MKARDIIVLFAMLLAWIPVHSQIQFTGNALINGADPEIHHFDIESTF